MSTVKVTVTLGQDELDQVRALVRKGKVANVSAFVQHAVRRSLDDAAGFAADLAEALELTGGPATPEEKEWAAAVRSGRYTTETMPEFPRSPGRTIYPPGMPDLELVPEPESPRVLESAPEVGPAPEGEE